MFLMLAADKSFTKQTW